MLHRTHIIDSISRSCLVSLTGFYTTLCDLYSHSWCLVFETILKCLLYSSNVFRKSNFVLGVINRSNLLNTCITRSQTSLHTHTHTITHPACNTTDSTDVHTPSYVLYCSFLQYSGRLVHKGDALPTGKGVFFSVGFYH